MRNIAVNTPALLVRNIVFGVEDSLVSTVGLLSGVAIVGTPRGTILLMGVVLIVVEAFSMAVGSFFSEESSEEYEAHGTVPIRESLLAGAVMFVSYFVSGFVPLTPYFFTQGSIALTLSIGLALTALFILGAASARIFGIKVMRKGLEMLAIGGAAIALGVAIGTFLGVK